MTSGYVDVARAATARGEVVLRRRGTIFELRVNGVFVMDTAETGSEIELARAALGRVARPRAVLVGGLGLGFTVHAVLADARVERLVVVELEAALVGWMRDGTVPHGPAYLADERLVIQVQDIRAAIAEAPATGFDLALLDVDNGPDFLVYEGNAAIYQQAFLAQVRGVLGPGGALAIWSAAPSEALQRTMAGVFGACEANAHPVVLQGRDETYWLYLSRVLPAA
jgi:spermidine synthase